MKQWIKTAGMLALLSASAMAQSQGPAQGGTYDPVKTMWWVFFMIYGVFTVIIGTAVLWHCGHGALGSHDGMAKVINVLIFGAIGFGVIYILQNMVTGVVAPRI